MDNPFKLEWKDLRRRDVQWRLFWITLFLVFVTGLILLSSMTQRLMPRNVRLTFDTNGVPAILGVRLANTNIRSAAFFALRTLGIRPSVIIPERDVFRSLPLIRRSGIGTNVMIVIRHPG